MRISLVSWIVSLRRTQGSKGHPCLEPVHNASPADQSPFDNAGVRSMLGRVRTSATSQTGPRCLLTLTQPSIKRTSWPEGPDNVAPVVIPALAPLWIIHSMLRVPRPSQNPSKLMAYPLDRVLTYKNLIYL